ncbi:MAG: GDP-mannose 4,6-dehydratase [Desulfobacterales bacterium]
MNLLVTGGCGFIGTNFIRWLLSNPDFTGNIINVDRLTYAGNPENLKEMEKWCRTGIFLCRPTFATKTKWRFF